MATYTAIPDTDIDADSPVNEVLLSRLRDNPIAIAEGASGAPKVSTTAIDSANLTFQTNNTFFVSGGSNTIFPIGIHMVNIDATGPGAYLEIQYSSAWYSENIDATADRTIAVISDGTNVRIRCDIGTTATVRYLSI